MIIKQKAKIRPENHKTKQEQTSLYYECDTKKKIKTEKNEFL